MMCKKLLFFLVVVFLLASNVILAQNRTVSGTVTDGNGVPLPGVTVVEKGTTNGATADFDGKYSINIGDSAILVFSYIGFTSQEINVGSKSVINVTLTESLEALDEVVVTALGIKKEKKALSYSIQEVDSEGLERAANSNINSALQGKVAGVTIVTSGGVTGNARFDIRGASSLIDNDDVLWVVDGVPFSAGDTSDPGDTFGGVSNGGALVDINPNDIETVSVLKGGQAAALYGSRGANGVVLITTKTGRGSEGLGISYTGSTTFSTAAYFLDLQHEYGQGNEGVYDPRSRVSWGPQFDGVVRPAWTGEDLPYQAEDNLIEDFTRTAVNSRHAIAFSNSNDKGNYRASILSDKNEGIYKYNELKKLNFSLKAAYDINPWLNIDTKISYIRNRGQQRPDIGSYGFIAQLNNTPANIRTEDLAPGFTIVNGRHVEYLFGPNINDLSANPNANVRNPYFVREQLVNRDERNRMFGYLAGTIKFTDDLSLKLKYGLDFYRYQTIVGARFSDNVDPTGRPNYNTSEKFFKEENLEFLLRYNKDIGDDFTLGINVGGNNMRNSFSLLEAFSGGIGSENDFFLNAGTNKSSRQRNEAREIQSVYGFMDVSYKDYLFLNITARNDWSSALPSTDNSYFYPSVGVSALISEMTEMPDWITYLKLRGSVAQLGKDTEPYLTNPVFEFFNSNFNELNALTPNRLVSEDLKPEISSTAEVGLELRLFNSRFTLDATYYNERTKNQIIERRLSQVTGSDFIVDNVGLISNKGIELLATVIPVRTDDFSLGLTFNFAQNTSILEELITPEEGDEPPYLFLNTGGFQVVGIEGEKMGDILGVAFERDANGGIIVDNDGLPVETTTLEKLGNIQPDFTGSIGLDVNYKDFSLSALIGMQIGGDIFSGTEASATGSGNALKTLSLGREPFFVDGRLADGSPNLQITSPQKYWGTVSGITEEFMYDASYMKLSEISIGYNIPAKMLSNFIESARISLIGRNLFYLYRDTPGTVPDAGVFNTNFGSQGFDWAPVPSARSYGFSLNLNF